MHQTPARLTPTQRERPDIRLVTTLFILASTALHLILGGTIPGVLPGREPAQASQPISIAVLEKTPPTPTPTPRPSPTQQRRQARPAPRPAVNAKPVVRNARPEVRPVTLPSAQAAPGEPQQGFGPPPPPIEPPIEATPAASPTPVDARDIIVSARFIHSVLAVYPEIGIQNGWEGSVIILLTIGPEGVSDMRIGASSGYPALDQAALRAAKESTYSVPEMNGQPATETYRIIYTFSIDS